MLLLNCLVSVKKSTVTNINEVKKIWQINQYNAVQSKCVTNLHVIPKVGRGEG